jgi:hypothetical protein
VETEEGLRPIEEVEVGNFVLSRDEETGEIDLREVERVFVTPDTPILELKLESDKGEIEKLGTTAEHPFWVKAQGWVFASKLLPGDEIFTSNGGWLRVNTGTWLSERQTVYNFEVDEFHTYFVGKHKAWVHNNPCAHQGAHKKPIVIGENMKRVQQYADDIGGHAYRPFKNNSFDYDLAMKRNKRWIQDMKREGREIIDIGPDFRRRSIGRGPSDFYNMERRQLKGYDNYTKVFERTGKTKGGLPGLDF